MPEETYFSPLEFYKSLGGERKILFLKDEIIPGGPNGGYLVLKDIYCDEFALSSSLRSFGTVDIPIAVGEIFQRRKEANK